MRQGLDVDEVPGPLQPASGLVVCVEEDETLQELAPPLGQPYQDVCSQATADTNTR